MVIGTAATKRLFSEAEETSGPNGSKKPRVETARIRSVDNAWNSMYNCLIAYKEEHGHCNIPQRYKQDRKLANWVQRQREYKKVGKLSDERFQKLESIGFGWVFFELNSFDSMFDRLVAYKEETGDCSVPQHYKADPKLGNWVKMQRQLKKAGTLLPNRIEKLDSIGFVWIRTETFDSMCDRLCAYKEAHGHCKVPRCYEEDGKLWNWVIKQRYLKKAGKLLPERIEKLNSVGFVWSVRAAKAESVTIKKEAPSESKPKLKVWVEDTGDPNYV